jgi:RNA dependent RNA polymerase
MEIFLQNLPVGLNRKTLRRRVASAVKKNLSREVDFDLYRFPKKPRLGRLTFATPEIGLDFLLNACRNPFTLRGRSGEYQIKVSSSKFSPDQRLIEGLLRRTEERKRSQSELDVGGGEWVSGSTELRFKSIQWGVWMSDGIFGQCGNVSWSGNIQYDSDSGELKAFDIVTSGFGISDDTGINIANTTIHELFLVQDNAQPRLFLTLDRIPVFWSQNEMQHTGSSTTHSHVQDPYGFGFAELFEVLAEMDCGGSLPLINLEPRDYRIPALCSKHAANAPYCTVYVFNMETTDLERGFGRLCKSMRRDVPVDSPLFIQTSALKFSDGHDRLRNLYRDHDYLVAFQMESYVRNCLLLPSEIIDLNKQILQLTSKYEVERTVHILQNFASRLPIRTFEGLSQPLDLAEMLRDLEGRDYSEPIIDRANSAWIQRLDITPSAFNMTGPEWMSTNRVLRLHPEHHDRFLKVSFVEEDLTKIRPKGGMILDPILNGRWKSAFGPEGVNICGRRFYFLGFSQSSLREHSAWFLAPFLDSGAGRTVTVDSLLSGLGDFSRNIRCPPRFAARIGQSFTSTSHSIDLGPDEVKHIDDVGLEQPYFSDGIGTISQGMIKRIWKATTEKEVKPVVYQIRIGGSKGVLSLDTTLEGSQICLRPSMEKFDAKNSKLEIANKAQLLPLFLNRQTIVLLETLGLPPSNLIRLQEAEISRIQLASRDFDEGSKLCHRYGLGRAARLQKILQALKEQRVPAIFDMPFFRKLNALSMSFALKQIKHKSRIWVDRSWKLIGIMDEFKFLKEGQIYICLRDEETGAREYLKGDTLVTQMPALHCGDVQKAYAIGSVEPAHPLSTLYNCIVFSSEGKRPLPNQLSGGDLDGDLFDISQNPLLFPPEWVEPASYPSVRPKDAGRDCTMTDISEFFLDFIRNDNLGQICNRHLIIADQSRYGARDAKCIELSQLASAAVDFPKTGIPADIGRAPYINTNIKPDFMAELPMSEQDFIPGPPSESSSESSSQRSQGRGEAYFYRSNKVLGSLYRAVDTDELLKSWNAQSGWNENGPKELWKTIEDNLKKLVPSYKVTWSDYVKEAQEIFKHYMEDLKWIQWYYHPTPWKKHLSEAEVFLQCISMAPSARYVRGRGKSDYLTQLRQEYVGLVERVRSEAVIPGNGKFQRIAACFYVGIGMTQRQRVKEGESFAWLLIPDLFETWKFVEKNEFNDDDELDLSDG